MFIINPSLFIEPIIYKHVPPIGKITALFSPPFFFLGGFVAFAKCMIVLDIQGKAIVVFLETYLPTYLSR